MTRTSDVASGHCAASQTAATDSTRLITQAIRRQLKHSGHRLTSAAVLAAAVGISPVYAQQAPAAATDEPVQLTEVVVTGSRIAAPNQNSASPIQVLSTQSIQATGRNDLSDVLNQLPQIFSNDLGQDLGNRTSGLTTAGGVATADLRGLGPNRTLVMIDGRRLGIGSPNTAIQQPAPDLDQIPMIMVDRVEVVTGGASSVYGSDAIAGVVNFIMKKDFQGIQFDGQIGENWHSNHNSYAQSLVRDGGTDTPLTGTSWDGRNRNFSVLMGTNFADGQGNVTAYASYYHQDPVSSGQRDFGQCQMFGNSINGNTVDSAVCAGSSNSNFFQRVGDKNSYSVLGNNFVPNGTDGTTPPGTFNSQKFIFIQRDDTRYMAGFNAHYDVTSWAKPYMQFGFMDDRTQQQTAPVAVFKDSNPNDTASANYYVNCGNPLLSAQQAGILGCTPGQISAANQLDPANQVNVRIGRRNIEGGDRENVFQHTNYRAVFGSTGEIVKGLTYDAYGQFTYTNYFSSANKYFNFTNLDNALLVTTDPKTGKPVCVFGGAQCVPYNIFKDGGVTQEALDYLQTIGTQRGETTLRTYHADFTGQLGEYGIQLPTAHDGIAVNVGWEHRNENVTLTPDAVEQSGQLDGFGSAVTPINNSVSVDEGFMEARIPLVQDKTFAKDLVLSPGYRYSNYSSSGGVSTYKFDVQWQPIDDIRVRGSYQRAIRAPSIIELYNSPLVALASLGPDPCAPAVNKNGVVTGPPTATLEQCLHTVSPAQAAAFTTAYNAQTIPQSVAQQRSQLTGGNPALTPEKSKSYTVGFVFTPQALPTLTGSIDWWDIKLDDTINVIPADVILNNCLENGDPAYCSQLMRQTTSFGLTGAAIATGGYVIQKNFNIGQAEVQGIDLQTNYKLALGAMGNIRFALNGSYLLKNTTTPLKGAHTYNCAGLFGSTCQTVNPRWRHIFSTTWQTPWELDVGMNWRFIGKVGYDGNDPDPTLAASGQSKFGAYNDFNAQISNFSYFDLFVNWNTPWKPLSVRAGINNVLDKDPPIVTSEIAPGGAANTYGTYDQLGRQIYLAFTAKF